MSTTFPPTTVRMTVDEGVAAMDSRAMGYACDQLARLFDRVTGRDATAFFIRPPNPRAPLNMRYRYELMATDDPVALLVGLDAGRVDWRSL